MIAWMFPGQGSQQPGMGRDLLKGYEVANEIVDEAESMSGLPLRTLAERGPLEAMTRVQCLEPLLAAISIAYAQTLIDAGHSPDYVAGYSAGEVPALYVAGVLSRTDALRVATIRGQVLANHTTDDVRMVAIARVQKTQVKQLVDSLGSDSDLIQVAGWNAPDHVTIVGNEATVRRAESELVAQGAETTSVHVSGMWHTTAMKRATIELKHALKVVDFANPKIPVMTSASGQSITTIKGLRSELADQIALPVQWQSTIESLRTLGVDEFIEVGTGRTLMGMLRRNWKDATEYSVTSVEGRGGNIKPLKRILPSQSL